MISDCSQFFMFEYTYEHEPMTMPTIAGMKLYAIQYSKHTQLYGLLDG
jgi:hypothetical protein